MTTKTINVLKDFSDDPWGRDESENPISSGKKFRIELLKENFKKFEHIVVDFSDLIVIPDSSFLGEAFIGLVKKEGYSYEDVAKKITILPAESIYSNTVAQMLNDAKREDIRLGRL